VQKYLGSDAFHAEDFAGEPQQRAGLAQLFAPGIRGRTIFVGTFWACLVAPYFAIFTLAPEVLKALSLSSAQAGTIAINGIAALGAVSGLFIVERSGRRHMLIGPFWISAAALFTVGFWSHAPAAVIVPHARNVVTGGGNVRLPQRPVGGDAHALGLHRHRQQDQPLRNRAGMIPIADVRAGKRVNSCCPRRQGNVDGRWRARCAAGRRGAG
jgi:Sugar (and other) transporter